ncbi:MAG: neutral/alkaline non-lysosomal ceramidase N-terminal domain-containing protein [Bacteroidota bacterium]
MLVGVGKSKVIFNKMHVPMQGYGNIDHFADGIENDLFSRAFVFKKENVWLAIINLECCFTTHHLKKAIIDGFNLKHSSSMLSIDNVMFCSQNTHSAPGGYSHYPFFNFSTRGFRPSIFASYKNACIEALSIAYLDIEPSDVFLNVDLIDSESDVAFNRSIEAYNSNNDIEYFDDTRTQFAIDRMIKQFRICSNKSVNKGLINWFGVKGTSISEKNSRIHPDNKGYAASLFENDKSEVRNFVAAFCSESQGDVSPNYYGRSKWWPRGRYDDEFKSAFFSGFIQFENARNIFDSKDHQIPLKDSIDFIHYFVDMSKIVCDSEFTNDKKNHETGSPVLGLSFLEGDGIDKPFLDSVSITLFNSINKYKETLRRIPLITSKKNRIRYQHLKLAHGTKKIFIELQDKKILGYSNLNKIPLPNSLKDLGYEIKKQYNSGALKNNTWAPIILPIQIFIIGEIAIVGFPGEISTIAGKRLKKTLLNVLEKRGVIDVIITSNSNEFCGYTTTYEEYQFQHYEGSFTLFGQHTLAAFQTVYKQMALKLCENRENRILPNLIQPPNFSKEEMDKRTVL